MRNKILFHKGFTLLEILIALFVFTVISLILTSALHNVIAIQSGTESHAERLRKLQLLLLMISRDVEQSVNRPVMNASGKEESAFIGTSHGFIFTHAGLANPLGTAAKSTLQRTGYQWKSGTLSRVTWDALDQAPESKSHKRELSADITNANFEYLDKDGRFRSDWPLEGQDSQPLPRAVRVNLTILEWGKLSQLYVIAAQPTKATQMPPKP